MMLSQQLRSQIYQAARKCVSGSSPLFEVSYRLRSGSDRWTSNSRLWDENADLGDLDRLSDVKTLEMDEQGLCELDLYATTTHRGSYMGTLRELERNVYVLVSAESVVWATSDERERARLAGEPWGDP